MAAHNPICPGPEGFPRFVSTFHSAIDLSETRGVRHRSGAPWTPIRAATVRERLPHTCLQFVRLEHAHRLTLLGDDILHGRRDVLWFPQPSCAAVVCPSLPLRLIQPHPVQTAAAVSFAIAHDSLRRNLCFHHRVHVIAFAHGPPADSSHDAHTPPESLPVPHRD